jgi:hypothetical protein
MFVARARLGRSLGWLLAMDACAVASDITTLKASADHLQRRENTCETKTALKVKSKREPLAMNARKTTTDYKRKKV